MTKVKIIGFSGEVRSVSLTRFISSKTQLTLTQSFEKVDKLLSGQPVIVEFVDFCEDDSTSLINMGFEFTLVS